MKKRCRDCGRVLTWTEEIYNPSSLCDDCLQKEKEAFIHKGGGNDPETANPEMKSMEARDVNEDEGDK